METIELTVRRSYYVERRKEDKASQKGRSTNIIPREVQEKEGIKFLFFCWFFRLFFSSFQQKRKSKRISSIFQRRKKAM